MFTEGYFLPVDVLGAKDAQMSRRKSEVSVLKGVRAIVWATHKRQTITIKCDKCDDVGR